MWMNLPISVAVLLVGGALQSSACTSDTDRLDNRMKVNADGSFQNANLVNSASQTLTYPEGEAFPLYYVGGEYDVAHGGPIRDGTNGRVVQTIAFSNYGCEYVEALLFKTCNEPQSILLFGKVPDTDVVIEGSTRATVDQIQPPLGPIAISGMSTVETLVRVARAADIRYLINADGVFDGVRKRDAYDPALGCKMFYPNSPGARP